MPEEAAAILEELTRHPSTGSAPERDSLLADEAMGL